MPKKVNQDAAIRPSIVEWSPWYVPRDDTPFIYARKNSDVTAKMNWAQFRNTGANAITFKWQPVGVGVGHVQAYSLPPKGTGPVVRCDDAEPVNGDYEINILEWSVIG